MDANGQRFWMLSGPGDWETGPDARLEYDRERRSLRLMSRRPAGPSPNDLEGTREQAELRLAIVPRTRDAYGTWAMWDPDVQRVMAAGALPGRVSIVELPAGESPADLVMGHDGVLYLAVAGRVVLHDVRGRWSSRSPQADNAAAQAFRTWRLAADPRGGVWALDRERRQLARVVGMPLPDRPFGEYAPGTFRPRPEEHDPPRLFVLAEAVIPDTDDPVAIASSPDGMLAVLCWTGALAHVHCLGADGRWVRRVALQDVRFPYSLTWVSAAEVAVLTGSLPREALVYDLESGDVASTTGNFYPLRQHNGGAFIHGLDLPPHYPTAGGTAPLRHLSLPACERDGAAHSLAPFDSGSTQTAWHRLYLEACIPPGCGIKVFVAAGNTRDARPADAVDWHEHRIGERYAGGASHVPRGAWVPCASEVPFHEGLLPSPRVPHRTGLFTVLIQRNNRRVRTLQGRYLHVRVELEGDGRATPELWALRAYAPRFSYVQRYLPRLYHETLIGRPADEPLEPGGNSTPADFLERFVLNFEGILTLLEDRIGGAYHLTDPRSAPAAALPWLASWIGVAIDPAFDEPQQRRLLRAAPQLAREHGTLRGLQRSLDIATRGGVGRGRLVVLEDFRLRRTFATILGADLADEDDPLTAGLVASGNSFVGDTLFVGDEHKQELLALFGAEAVAESGEAAAVQEFLDRLAHCATVLVHEAASREELRLVRRVVDLESPAHVATRIVTARHPFLVGLASLVGVDSYLRDEPPPGPVRTDHSRLGVRDLLIGRACLDHRLERSSAAFAPPVADAGDDQLVEYGHSILLDGGRSQAAEGRHLTTFRWTRQD